MKIYAIADLHIGCQANKRALEQLPRFRDDWLIVAGDIGESLEHLKQAFTILVTKFQKVIWVPGNHDLWAINAECEPFVGLEKYTELIRICHNYGVITPEDSYPYVELNGEKCVIAPVFTLYDYSFHPKDILPYTPLDWAISTGVICSDEELLITSPYSTVMEWCQSRCLYTDKRLQDIPRDVPIILVNHFPLIQEHAFIRRYPGFSIWCGTKFTEDWLTKFNIKLVVYGHLHIRKTSYKDGVKFEEVSLGYPTDWDSSRGIEYYLKELTIEYM